MQITIVGAGGIGGFLAANLNPTRHDVQLVARGAHLDAIRERGLRFLEESGAIRHVGGAGTVVVGVLDGQLGSADKVRAALADSVVHAEVTSDILGELWRKFLFVAPFGGLGAVTGASIGELRSTAAWRGLLRQSMLEVESLALQRDLAARRPSELDAWTGAIVRLGEQSGVPTPINTVLHQPLVPRQAQ